MNEQYKLTIYVGGPANDLPDRLVHHTEVIITSKCVAYWDSGIDGVPAMQPGTRIEATTDRYRVPVVIDTVEKWFRESDYPTVMLEIADTFLRRIDRDS